MSSPLWRFDGAPRHLQAQGRRLGVSRILIDRAGRNPEIHRVGTIAAQLCDRYHRAPKPEGVATISAPELAQVQGAIGQCEQEVEKLHALAAASHAILDEIYRAYGLAVPERKFRVACDFDPAA